MPVIFSRFTKLFFVATFTLVAVFFSQNIALAAVAHDVASESHTGTTGSTNQSSFSWTHTPSGTPRGVLVFVHTVNDIKRVTGVTYGGVTMTEIAGGAAVDANGEQGRIDTFFLGASIPTGAQTIVVSRSNNGDEMYASASTQTASVNTEVYTTGIVLLQEQGSFSVQSVTDGSTGVNSLRYASGFHGANNPLSAGTGSTVLNSIDYGSQTSTTARETTAGQGARNVGFTSSSDDRAGVHLAVREIPATGTVSASPTSCTISSGASTCTVPFTWSISNATSPNLYNATTANQYSTSASGTGVSYSITNGSNTVQARNSSTILATTVVTASCTGGTSWSGSACQPVNTPPALSISEPNGVSDSVNVGASYNITYSLSDTEEAVTAAFYYDTNASGLDGTAISGACATAPEGSGVTCSWNTTGVTPGSYYVYGLTSDGIASQVSAYSTGTITINAVPTFAITASSGVNGSVTPDGVTNVPQGGSQAYSITPDSGYGIATLVVDSVSIATSTSHTFTNVQAIHTISATFALLPTPPVTHTITSSVGSNGSITPLGATIVTEGNSQGFTITPDNGFTIATLVVDAVSIATSTSYTFSNVLTDHTISATFALIPAPPGSFTIVATSGTGGTVSPSGSTVVTQGDSQAYSITPSSGYDIATLIIDSISIATSTSYTFSNVQASHTIEATFVAPAAEVVGGVILASITFDGKAFPGGTASIVHRELDAQVIDAQVDISNITGSFHVRFVDLPKAIHTFGLLIKDKEGRLSQTKFYTIDANATNALFENIVAPPTVDVLSGQVSRGGKVRVFGFASPSHTVRLYINDILSKETLAGNTGVYSFDIPTGALDFGQYTVRAKQINLDGGKESEFSTSRTFIVSKLTVVKADLSGDGKIDIKDWSIFLARFVSRDSEIKKSIDLTGDGKVDISDFSVFIRTIRK